MPAPPPAAAPIRFTVLRGTVSTGLESTIDIHIGNQPIGGFTTSHEIADAFEAMVRTHDGVCDALEGLITEVTDLLSSPEHLRMILEVGGMDPTGDDAPEAFREAIKWLALARPPVVAAVPEGGE